MSETPSSRRRRGRRDYYRGGNPDDHNPYRSGFMFEAKAADWLDGWLEAEATDMTDRHDEEQDRKKLEAVARAIWNIRREEEDRCDMELEDIGDDHSVWAEAQAAIDAWRAL